MRQALRMLARDWRAGELRILAMALVIAVAAVTSVAFFADRVGQALVRDAHQLLGADLVLASDHPWKPQVQDEIRARGLEEAAAVNFISMAFRGDKSQLAGVKAVTENYPLRGRLRVAAAPGAQDVPAEHGPRKGSVWLEERLVSALDAPVGSRVRLGKTELEVAAVLTLEPERSANFFNIAPRLLMNLDDVAATGLIQTGSRVSYFLYAAGAPLQITALESFVSSRLERGQRVDNLETGRPEVRASVERARRFLALTALLAAVLAGVAIALGTRRFVERHLDGCAVMRCLGATQGKLLRLYGAEFALLAAAACAAGVALGYFAQTAIASCAMKPSTHPAAHAPRPSRRNSSEKSLTSCACVAPRQRITAQPSRWRSTKRRVPRPIATPARIAASSAVSPRKRSARSIAERISGRPVSSVSTRWPRSNRGRMLSSTAFTAGAGPATYK